MSSAFFFVRLVAAMMLALAPALAAAETDFEVTMRMVEDEDVLDSSFVQEMELPESVNELDVTEIRNDAREMEETLASESRETRDALDLELPGEEDSTLPVIDLPDSDLTDPDLPLPTDQLPGSDLDLLDTGDTLLDNSGELLNNTSGN
ncbi:hypothetical protein MD273_12405 [Marinobacter pelagius]|uniref:hypothetical protein n=1 Tax=Marinobacter sp. C7 TaxID=2951363 RepID=UPI001EF1603F|nr:hypothetical protein [Marinobacter sp. C7]MCG7200526.1 hypothetical protein [Marinobacter sp. C7]